MFPKLEVDARLIDLPAAAVAFVFGHTVAITACGALIPIQFSLVIADEIYKRLS